MSKAFSIHVRVDRQQKEIIESNAKANGFGSTSDFMRARGLVFHPIEEKVHKIYMKLYSEASAVKRISGADKRLNEFIL